MPDAGEEEAEAEPKQCETVYVRNLNERIKLPERKKALEAVFARFGKIRDVCVRQAHLYRGNAFVIFEDPESAKEAVELLQGFVLFEKPMFLAVARERSDIVTKEDGTWKPREKKQPRAAGDAEDGEPSAKRGRFDAGPRGKAEALPNETLFLQGLPATVSGQELSALFARYAGFKEVRTIPGRVGLAFVDYDSDAHSAMAMEALQGHKFGEEVMQISFAKR